MPESQRPACIVHWSEIEEQDNSHYEDDDELMAISAPFGQHFGLTRHGIHHQRLLPGRRTSYPHAESTEEEFVYVLEGVVDAWVDGVLHPMRAGDLAAFPAGTGVAHTFINNGEREARLLVGGEASKPGSQIDYPLNPERRAQIAPEQWWDDVPSRELGPHDGKPTRR